MIKLNRTTEYGLMALKHMSRKRRSHPPEVTSAREIADSYGLPFEITAKTLQRLKDTGLIQSAQGARGGYILLRALEDISLAEFLELMEGPQSIVACASGSAPTHEVDRRQQIPLSKALEQPRDRCSCEYRTRCEIQHVMSDLNLRVHNFLSSIRLAELAEAEQSNTGF